MLAFRIFLEIQNRANIDGMPEFRGCCVFLDHPVHTLAEYVSLERQRSSIHEHPPIFWSPLQCIFNIQKISINLKDRLISMLSA